MFVAPNCTSSEVNEIAAALAKAQGEMPNAVQNKINPHFRSKYADWASIRDAAEPSLSKHGISYTQISYIVCGSEGIPLFIVWRTMLIHTSGQWIASEYPIPYTPDKPQIAGSNTTYACRITFSRAAGIASEEDDDANAAQQPSGNNKAADIRMSEDHSADVCQAMLEQIEELDTIEGVDDYAKEHAGLYGKLTAKHQELVKKATNARRKKVTKTADDERRD